MRRLLSVLIMCFAGAAIARAQLPAQTTPAQTTPAQPPAEQAPVEQANQYAPILLRVACGGTIMAICTTVMPKLAAQTSHAGVELKPAGSGRVIDTAAAVCDGLTAAAITQADAVALLARLPLCAGKFTPVGRPLFPYYGFLIVRADSPFRQLDDMSGGNRRRLVMAGADGTGGQITFSYLIRSNPALQRGIAALLGDLEVGLQRVADGTIDGYFTVDTLDSAMIDKVRTRTDAHGRPLFTFIDIRPPQTFFRDDDGFGHCLYRLTALDFGGTTPVTTISLDAVMVLGRAFRDAHAKGGPRMEDVMTSAIDAAEPAILAAIKSPTYWRPAGASCQ
jgi:hypothetical protein